jgi:hypothetical protein
MEITSPDIVFRIREGGLPVPYPAVDRETEDTSNYGYRMLKNRVEEISLVPETRDDPALAELLHVLNSEESPFFSIGCARWLKENEGLPWISGYIEFSFNYLELTQDAQNYFRLFFEFHYFVRDQKSDLPVYFDWEIQGATFGSRGHAGGYVLGIMINTQIGKDRTFVFDRWSSALKLISDFLRTRPNARTGLTRIY